MNPIVLLVRHGRTELNDPANPRLRAWENPPLDRRGQLDAHMAAQTIKGYAPKTVYSSDLTRDASTGIIISQDLGNIPYDTDYALRTADMGELAGELDAEVAPMIEKWYTEPWWKAPGGESNNNFLSRFYPAFDLKFNLAKECAAYCPTVIVSHGRNIAAIHARSDMLPQVDAAMPFPGGVASVFINERGEMKLEFLTDTEPVHRDA